MTYFNNASGQIGAMGFCPLSPMHPPPRGPWGRTYPLVLEPPKPVFLLLGLWEADILFLFLSFLVLSVK